MAIIRQAVNLTAGLGETIYTVPANKQASLTVSVANAADTYVAVQTTDLGSSPTTQLDTTFSNSTFNFFGTTAGYEIGGTNNPRIYRRQASNKYAADSGSYIAYDPHAFQIPRTSAFNYDAAIARLQYNDIYWRPNGTFDNAGENRTGNGTMGSEYVRGAASIGTEALSFRTDADYFQYQNCHTTPTAVQVTGGHYFNLVANSGWDPNNYSGANLAQGISTHYIYKQMDKSSAAPIVLMWDAGDINSSTNNTLSRALQFTGIPNGSGIVWIQESGSYTMICCWSGSTSGTLSLYILNQSAWSTAGVNSNPPTTSSTCTDITDASWSAIPSREWLKPFVDGNSGIFYFRSSSSPYPFTYNANTDTWDFSGTPTVQTYPAEISSLEATLGDAYSFYKYGSTLNDYYIVAGSSVYSLIPNYNALDANSTLLTSLQNNSEKGGLALKAGDKVISYDTLSGGSVVQVYGYEEDA